MITEVTDLKQTAQNIIDAAINLSVMESNASQPVRAEVVWANIRHRVNVRCHELVRLRLITSFNLQETNTEDIVGWSIAQGSGKIFALWLYNPPVNSISCSEPRAVVH